MRQYLFLLFICIGFSSIGQKNEFELIKFNSEFEKNFFHNLEEASDLDILLGIGQLASKEDVDMVQEKIDGLIAKLKEMKFKSQTPKKQAKMLEKLLHGKVLKQYQLVSPFYHIFFDGEYNCVSSSALYAIFLEEFDIPYSIQELPTHVYVVMYPKTDRIKVETTAPKKGYYVKSEGEVKRIMKGLIRLGVVSKEKVKRLGYREAYNRYYYKPKGITLRQLAALQYYNESLVHRSENDLNLALSEISKSYYIYPGKLTTKLKLEMFKEKLNSYSFNRMSHFKYLKEYVNTSSADMKFVEYKYLTYLQAYLEEVDSLDYVDRSYAYLMGTLNDSIHKVNFSEWYHLGLTQYAYNNGNFYVAASHASSCLIYNPKNTDVLFYIANGIKADFDHNRLYDDIFDSTEEDWVEDSLMIRNEVDEYLSKKPNYEEAGLRDLVTVLAYYSIAYNALLEDDELNGMFYMFKCITLYKDMENNELVGDKPLLTLFEMAGEFYLDKKDLDSAAKFVERGLKVNPGYQPLKKLKKEIDDLL